MKIGIVPQHNNLFNDDVLKIDMDVVQRKGGGEPMTRYRQGLSEFKQLLEPEHSVHTIDYYDDLSELDQCMFIDIRFDYLKKLLSLESLPTLICLMRESPAVDTLNNPRVFCTYLPLFDKVFTWNDSLADGHEDIISINWPQNLDKRRSRMKKYERKDHLVNISTRKFSSHPNEIYSERMKVINYYENNHPDDFDLFGMMWHAPPRLLDLYKYQKIPLRRYDTYRGFVEDKLGAYHNYRFAISFENITAIDGWLTEKMFDCFKSGIVPVYWGADNVTEFVPEDTFIDYREYLSPELLYERLKSIDKEEYKEFQHSIDKFLQSKEAEALTPTRFAEIIRDNILGIDPNNSTKIPQELRNEVSNRGLAELLINNYDEIPKKKYLARLLKLGKQQPSIFIEDPRTILRLFK